MTAVDLTGPDARWTAGRDDLVVVYVDGLVVARECRACRAVKPTSALLKRFMGSGVPRISRHKCRACGTARRRVNS